jgi:hypothetical protein
MMRLRSNAAHALHNVEHRPLGNENAAGFANHLKRHIAAIYGFAIGEAGIELHAIIQHLKNPLGYRHSRQNSRILDEATRTGLCARRNGRKAGMVAAERRICTEIFGKRTANDSVGMGRVKEIHKRQFFLVGEIQRKRAQATSAALIF